MCESRNFKCFNNASVGQQYRVFFPKVLKRMAWICKAVIKAGGNFIDEKYEEVGIFSYVSAYFLSRQQKKYIDIVIVSIILKYF